MNHTVWSYCLIVWHRTMASYLVLLWLHPFFTVLYWSFTGFLSVNFCFPVLVFVNLHMMSFQIFYSSWLLDWFQMLPFYIRQESIAKIIWTTWICDEIFFGEIKWNESKNIILLKVIRQFIVYSLEQPSKNIRLSETSCWGATVMLTT